MASRPKRRCIDCGQIVTGTCADCKRAKSKAYDATRQDDIKWYKSPAWRKFRDYMKARYPLCRHCEGQGKTTAATYYHHVKPRKEYPELALTESNVIGLCGSCHSRHEAYARGDRA